MKKYTTHVVHRTSRNELITLKINGLAVGVPALLAVSVIAYSHLFPQEAIDGSAPDNTSTIISRTAAPTRAATSSPTVGETATPASATHAAENAARQGLTTVFTWYPGIDTTQNDAYGRARDWLTDSFAARMIKDARTERGPSVQWAQWAEQQAKVIADVSIECSGCPTDTVTAIHRVATIEHTVVSSSGTTTTEPHTTVWVTVVRERDRWLIDDIRY